MTAIRRIGWSLFLLTALFTGLCADTLADAGRDRFRYSGDGRLHLFNPKSGAVFDGVYRQADGHIDPQARTAIQKVFDAPSEEPLAAISMRLIAFLDYLEDRLRPGARIEIASGWRSPAYNTRLRESGRLAASASLHQYGMAADIRIEGVDSRQVWHFVRELGFGGAGYYQGRLVHVDVGPARFWDQDSSGVGSDISVDNKLIGLVTDFDRYRAGDRVVLRFIRMTGFPIGVQAEWILEKEIEGGRREMVAPFHPRFAAPVDGACPVFNDIGAMMDIRGRLPEDLPPGRYALRARFCDTRWEAMPEAVTTPLFEVPDRAMP
ncbi:YcbK family protein [Desulfatitalea alkaliphila]|uniref:Murein endopeptidase K n=1 Tax=Desulfatitalea alkaliphila TaxID=2929485 RepID=A0AA41R567_9BACT|nr:DUF882 domain-containing protein [Desulfatitalea alkaliphila]MCJ8501170.1 DUF882 domain-containing protein [Desulfatitalea alkaliphila]